ncbi:MAG: DUF4982 domain-containing protein [Acidobacteria bacterium]|nr:DUF4982 domain-containing protein [Acidobacteriota bacterium]
MKLHRTSLLIILFVLSTLSCPAAARHPVASPPSTSRTVQNFDFDWRFTHGDVPAASAENFNDSAWRKLDVPHDWSIEGEYAKDNPGGGSVGYLPAGIGWYRKTFDVSADALRKDTEVLFDGVFMDSTVWINGVKLGTEPYGYISFHYNLTKHLRAGANTIAVRVNNLLQPAARWYTGSGIYGHVWLITRAPDHIAQWSTFVRTLSLNGDKATISISTSVEGPNTANKRLRFTVLDAKQHTVSTQTASAASMEHPLELSVTKPALWSPDSPTLYTLRTELLDGKNIIDAEDTPFGIRTMRFDPDKGFFLNDQPLKIRGVADHLFAGTVGAAIPDALYERQIRLLKEMGANAIRVAHNPRTPYFYDLCDRLGILVMDEIFDGWHKKVHNEFAERFYNTEWKSDVERWVRRDRNHPSVFAWSIGNETGLEDKNHMSELVHRFDPTRPTTGGMMTTGVDLAGFNGPGETPGVLEKFHSEHPKTPIILTEEPHTLQTRGYYRVRTWWRDWKPGVPFEPYGTEEIFFDGKQWYNSSYDNATPRVTARWTWKRTAATPWISGEFRWSGFDYIGEANFKGGHWPARAGNFGIIDLAGIPKDHFYLYQSLWTTKPMVHLLPHWTHRGMNGITIPVVAYSNQPEVELFLNGKSLGRHKPEELGDFVWKVPYTPGKLEAIAYDSAGQRTAETAFTTADDPTQIMLQTDNASLRPDRTDDAVVTFTVADKDGVTVPWSMDRIHVKVNGPVRLHGYENGDPTDVTAHQKPWRNAFYGLARGFYQSTAEDGPIDITAAAILGDENILGTNPKHPRMIAIAASRIALRGALAPAKLEIHYTLDGSEPIPASPVYTQPFGISDETYVRALVLKDGKPELMLTKIFRRTDEPVVTDPRWATDLTKDPATRATFGALEGAAADQQRLKKKSKE